MAAIGSLGGLAGVADPCGTLPPEDCSERTFAVAGHLASEDPILRHLMTEAVVVREPLPLPL